MALHFQSAKKMKLSDYEILKTVGTGSKNIIKPI